jgi:hypothetical protein
MKILIGLVRCIENEFEACLQSIKDQTHKDWEIFFIENLPKKEAHDQLYGTFMRRSGEFDLFIKVDADMVLSRPTLFEEIVSEMNKRPHSDHFQIGVWDYFTDQLIYAFHAYRSSVKWNIQNEQYFTDSIHYKTHCTEFMDINGPLAPAAQHSPNPSPFQAFHFGIHKAVKVIQNQRKRKRLDMAKAHLNNILLLWRNYEKKRDPGLAFALHGAFWAFRQKATYEAANYSSKNAKSAFDQIHQQPENQRQKAISKAYHTFKLWMPLSLWHQYMISKYTYDKNEIIAIKNVFKVGIKRLINKKNTPLLNKLSRKTN